MTQEDKELLLKDLCARLPYGVKLGFENSNLILVPKEFNIYTMCLSTNQIYPKSDSMVIGHIYDVWNYRPYLRPMSSMTEEEREELSAEQVKDENIFLNIINHSQLGDDSLLGTGIPHHAEDWANKNHFDYRGLIPMGLALEAPEWMYKI